jgi:hypothetical protein
MKNTNRFSHRSRSIAIASILIAASSAAHDVNDATSMRSRIDHSRVLYDTPGDGRIWARGASYKASFGADGATYFPFLGSRAPRNYPHMLSPDRVSVGGAALAIERGRAATRDGDHVAIDRGAFVESYELAPESIEQSFVFASLPAAREGDDLVVHIPVASDLAASETEGGIAFSSELGRVTYGRATAIDANGRRATVATTLADGSIELRLDASFVATAALPLVIDPLVSTIFFPDPNQVDDTNADVCSETNSGAWLVVWQEAFSASDSDVYCEYRSSTGALIASATIDFSTTSWTHARCAEVSSAFTFLVVADSGPSNGKSVSGRTVAPIAGNLTLSAQFSISGFVFGQEFSADVGGDPYLGSAPSYFCVVCERDTALISSDNISVYLVSPDTTVVTNVVISNGGNASDSRPSISKSDDTSAWLVAWQRSDVAGSHIDAAHVAWNGVLFDGPFQVTSGAATNELNPCASSPIRGTSVGMIAYERTPQNDIYVSTVNGTTVLAELDLSVAANPQTASVHEIEPSVDCDGQRFVVAYSEPIVNGTSPYNVFASQLYVSGAEIDVAEPHVLLHQFGLAERRPRVASKRTLSGLSHRSFVAYDFEQNPTDHDIAGALFDAGEGGTSSAFCGNATGQAISCPCGLNGTLGRGCPNSANSSGALLTVSGSLSTLDDTTTLVASGMPANASCIFLQGTATSGGVLFGDGVRCTAGTLIRLGVKTSSQGVASFPQSGDPTMSTKGSVPPAGGMRAYQAWYRDNNLGFCTSATFNISSGVIIHWAP